MLWIHHANLFDAAKALRSDEKLTSRDGEAMRAAFQRFSLALSQILLSCCCLNQLVVFVSESVYQTIWIICS